MVTAATPQATCKGFDLGTSRIVVASLDAKAVTFKSELNAFIDMPHTKMTEKMLASENILHKIEGQHIYAYGNRTDEFAKFLNGDARRPMQSGVLNPSEPKNLQMIELLIEQLCGKAGKGEKVCFSIPSAPSERKSDLIFHERSVLGIFDRLGYKVQSVNEGLAIVYAELKEANFTGIDMSFGGGMCNLCLAYLGMPVFTLATTRAGDYIDQSAASVTGETPTTVRLHKENGFRINGGGNGIDHALSIYYADVIETAVKALEGALAETKKLPKFAGPVPIVCAGGTSLAKGFATELKTALESADLPIQISEIHVPKDPLNTTAKGALVAAMLNM
ncbi:MAG: hypothetical protein JO010_02045 [Alphaproteobacteria bacterium]|nr:hypothetical protein [Alphaproteobacteria bacterium]